MASALFCGEAPWTSVIGLKTIGMAFSGDVTSRMFARLLGVVGGAPGLALYSDRDAVDRMVVLIESESPERALAIDVLGSTCQPGPPYALDALQRAYGLSTVPVPLKRRSRATLAVDDLDLLTLAAALRSIAVLSTGGTEAHASVSVDTLVVSALAFL